MLGPAALAAMLSLPVAALAQSSQADLIAKRDRKLASEVFQRNPWVSDFDQARETAREKDALLFAYFTRSYAPCPPCAALERGALSSPEFARFAEDAGVVLFLHVTSHVEDEPYPDLLDQKGFGRTTPSLCIMDAEGRKIALLEGRDVDSFAAAVRQGREYLQMVEKVRENPDDRALAKKLFLKQLFELGNLTFTEARAEQSALSLRGAEAKRVQAAIVGLEVDSLLKHEPITDPAARKRLIELIDEPALAQHRNYWGAVVQMAVEDGDLEAFDRRTQGLRKAWGERYWPQVRGKLEQARKQAEANARKG